MCEVVIVLVQPKSILIKFDIDLGLVLFRNPQICFSVTAQESEPSKEFVEIMKLIEENKSELRGVINSIEKLTRSLKKYMKKFKKKKGKYQKLMDDMEPVVKDYLEHKKLCIRNTGSSSY